MNRFKRFFGRIGHRARPELLAGERNVHREGRNDRDGDEVFMPGAASRRQAGTARRPRGVARFLTPSAAWIMFPLWTTNTS